MSPILVRPVREQLEHDRLIRLLQAKNRRRYEVAINPGAEQNAPVGSGVTAVYPDLVLSSPERGHRLQVIVEVETGESVNHLEALSQWVHLSKLRAAFHLYVPTSMVEVARRLCQDNEVRVHEIWSYHTLGDQVRFTLVHRSREIVVLAPRPRAGNGRAASSRRAASRSKSSARPAPKVLVRGGARKPAKKAAQKTR